MTSVATNTASNTYLIMKMPSFFKKKKKLKKIEEKKQRRIIAKEQKMILEFSFKTNFKPMKITDLFTQCRELQIFSNWQIQGKIDNESNKQ